MTILAGGFRGAFITMDRRLAAVADLMTMKRLSTMAIDTGHAILPEVNVGTKILVLAQEFGAYTAAVTRCACTGHGRIAREIVPVEQTTADAGGLAYMAVTAAGVTASAVIAKHLVHSRIFSVCSPGLEHGPIAFLCRVKACFPCRGFVIVATAASLCRSNTWPGNQFCMGDLFIRVLHSVVTFGAFDHSMNGIRISFAID